MWNRYIPTLLRNMGFLLFLGLLAACMLWSDVVKGAATSGSSTTPAGQDASKAIEAIMQTKMCSNVTKDIKDGLIAGIKLRLYYGTESADNMAVPLSNATDLIRHENFNSSRGTQIITFGFTRTVDYPSVRDVILAYIANNTYNLIVIDWSSITTTTSYGDAVSVMTSAAAVVAKAVDSMIGDGLQLVCLTGHSLGAQFVGHIGRNMKHVVGCMVALDPAGPLFYNQPPLFLQCADPVAPGDAVIVQAIHTDRGVFGAINSTADVDYFVNGGYPLQPGCPECSLDVIEHVLLCSHERALYMWGEILRKLTAFLGRRCESNVAFMRGDCNNNSTQYIGQCSNNTILGNFYLTTNCKSPYGKGVQGASPPKGGFMNSICL